MADVEFLRAEDFLIGGEFKSGHFEIVRVLPSVELTDNNGKKTQRKALALKGRNKVFVLNPQNEGVLRSILGDVVEKSVGMKIELSVQEIRVARDEVVCLRIIPPVGTKMRKGLINGLGKKAVFHGGTKFGSQTLGSKPTDEQPEQKQLMDTAPQHD